MISRILVLILFPCALAGSRSSEQLVVYREVPGLEPSEQYAFKVRKAGCKEPWQEAFAFITRCKEEAKGKNAYFPHLSGWSNTYINFEMSGSVEIEIRRPNGQPIQKAVPHPRRKVSSCKIQDGKAYVTIGKPSQITVDIDGQMDGQDTGKGYQGRPIHTLTIFANPILKDRPQPNAPDVHAVKPGVLPPREGNWKTLYFLPGVHDIGTAFPLHANRNYYIPGDALVYGTMGNYGRWKDGHNIRVFGYGTLSGARVAHPEYADPKPELAQHHNHIRIDGAANSSVEGITLADSPYHSLMLVQAYKPEVATDIRWAKIFTWRRNGDGINPFGNGLVEDCFIRTQDDSTYVNGRGIRRVTYWNDFNGSTFVLSAMPNRSLVVEDCDVLYARAGWHKWSGGRLFNMRGEGKGNCGKGVVFQNIRVEDPRPTLQHFMITMQGVEPWSDPKERKRGPGHFSGVVFRDIEIAAPSILGEPEILWGAEDAKIKDVTFENVTIGGKKLNSIHHFHHNGHVEGILFK